MKHHFIKRLTALLLAMILTLGMMPTLSLAADENVVIKLHYNRPDGNYADWSVWFWNYGQEGTDIPFEDVGGEKVATFNVAPGVTSVGYIVKLPNWAEKDVNEDQFIDVAVYTSGTVHIYVESGVKGHETVLGDDIVSGIKVKKAVYKEETGLTVQMTADLGSDPASALTITGPEGNLTITNITAGDFSTYTIETQEGIDLFGSYTVTFMGQVYPIQLPNVYSTKTFEEAYTYEGNDLGANWTKDATTFRVWAPTATAVKVNLYTSGTEGTNDRIEQLEMTADEKGTWIVTKEGDLNGVYYTYEVSVNGTVNEACDPYAKTTGVNGKRAMVIDMTSTNPEGWDADTDPHYGNNITDAVIYELHVRDLSVDENSGIENKGKFLGIIETGTTNSQGVATGLDHIKDLGVTHVHLLPSYDYASVDESKLDQPQFNWGYDPVNYNVPEGSYSTDPYDGFVRVKEFKQMVKGLHDNGISVIMDVVYNHVYNADTYCFNQIVPQYFSRTLDNGSYSSGSGCGNDTASERSMVSKYIVDSVKYWADEYHIDGFRFDLVGLIDTVTINAVIEEVHKTHPNVIFYGEGWTMTTHVTKEGYYMTTQVSSARTPEFAFFSDTIRDGLKGGVFNNSETGYVSGASVKTSIIEGCFRSASSWTKNPTQTVNYASCHDNMTLYDRLLVSTPEATDADRIRMNNLAAAIYLTSQGIPFVHAGEEMLRSKPLGDGTYDHNSYKSSDEVNNLKWENLNDPIYQDVYEYYKGLIAFRAAHPALRMTTAEEVNEKITTLDGLDPDVLAFHIAGGNGETDHLFVVFNPNETETTVALPEGEWTIYINGEDAGTEALGTVSGQVTVDPISACVLTMTPAEEAEAESAETETTEIIGGADAPTTVAVTNNGTMIIAAVLAVAAIAAFIILRKRKQ